MHLPALGRTYAAALGRGARLNGAPISASARTEIEGARMLATASQMAPAHWQGRAPAVERHFRPSLAYRLCLVADGEADAALTLRDTWEWDVAAGDLIAREAGAAVSERTGHAPGYNKPQPPPRRPDRRIARAPRANPRPHLSVIHPGSVRCSHGV